MNKKFLVTYFSASGETRQVAEALGKALKADIMEIEPQERYTNADLNWNDKQSRSSMEMKDLTMRPAMVQKDVDVSAYDEILVGFPIWWGIAPTIINTFMEAYDFTGKTLRAFATSGGSRIENCEKMLKRQYPSVSWEKGKLLNGFREIETFAKSIQ